MTDFSHAECVRDFFEYRAWKGRVPFEKNSVIRARYTHVLNSNSLDVYEHLLLTIAGNTFKSMIIPKQFKYGEIGTIVSVWKNFFKIETPCFIFGSKENIPDM